MQSQGQFQPLDVAIARLSVLSQRCSTPTLPRDANDAVELRKFLAGVAADPLLREAISVSSNSLERTLRGVSSGRELSLSQLRRAAFAAMRYLSRMTHRPTPFGLMAGVTPVDFGEPRVRVGSEHRRHARVDMGWLIDYVRPKETEPEVLAGLRLVANDLAFVRGDRLVLPHVRDEVERRGPDDREHTIRYTAAVRAAMTKVPIRFPDLVASVRAVFPAAKDSVVAAMVTELVRREFLLTDLRQAAPKHLPELAEIGLALEKYAASGGECWQDLTAAMRELRPADRLVQVDLGIDASITLPPSVPAELAEAAAVSWRLAPEHLAPSGWLSSYRAEFLERYGVGVAVPVKRLLDPNLGLGAPTGFLLPPSPRRTPEPLTSSPARDALLFELASTHEREIVLDDVLIESLARPEAGPAPYLEMTAQLLADSVHELASGDFRLVVGPGVTTRPGAMFGRFLHVVPELSGAISKLATELAGDATPAQLIGPLVESRTANVAQVPLLTDTTIQVGVFADRPDAVSLDELAVVADHDRFRVVSTKDGRELVPMVFHVLNPQLSMPNAVRLLLEIGQTVTPPWPVWNWGEAERLPYLPRIRYGRTILASARWLLDPRLKQDLDWPEWQESFGRWREKYSVPDVVYAVNADNRVRVDLTSPAQLQMLHSDLRKRPGTQLQEEPAGGAVGTGWVDGHANEIVVPLRPVAAPVRTQGHWQLVSDRAYLPGGDWLYAKIYADPGRHTELLTQHLPALPGDWFFLRYRDDRPHLRVRFHGSASTLNGEILPALSAWAAELMDVGIISDLALDTYRPETERYGGPLAIEAAERLFFADTQSVLAQLVARESGELDLPMPLLLAANHLDLAMRIYGPGWQDWLLSAYPKGPHHRAFQECRREAMRVLGSVALPAADRRASAASAYGDLLRRHDIDVSGPLLSVLHLHHNRLAGINPVAEQDAYAIARGVVQARRDRERQESR